MNYDIDSIGKSAGPAERLIERPGAKPAEPVQASLVKRPGAGPAERLIERPGAKPAGGGESPDPGTGIMGYGGI